jgi:hypothetical protein
MNEIEKFIKMNSIIILEVSEDTATLKQYEEKLSMKVKANDTLTSIEEVLAPLTGKRACIINSDVLGVVNEKIKLKRLEQHTLHKVLALTLEAYLPYLAKIVKDEDSNILIQTHYESDNPALTITAGLIDDIQVVLLDVHYERNERVIPC